MNSSTFSFRHWLKVFWVTWVLIVVLFLFSSELLIRIKVEPHDNFEEHRRLFFNSNKSNTVFGDSHGAQGFTGEEDFVNLSYPSESVDIIDSKIRLYYAHRAPKKIVLQADPHLFSEYRIKENVKDYIRSFENSSPPILQILTPRHRKFLFLYWKALFSGSDFKSRFHINPDGSQEEDATQAQKEQNADLQDRVRLQSPQKNFQISPSIVTYQKILEYLKERKATVCLVTFPVSSRYSEEAGRFPEFEEARQWFQRMASQYGFIYANYWDSFKDPNLFLNEDHLNFESARMLTEKILADCFGETP